MKRELAVLAVLYLIAHLLYLPRSLEDIDSINFALGVRDFDVARHQPHPPGYPVFIALGKASTAMLQAAGVRDAVAPALASISAIAATSLIPLLFLLFRRLGADAMTAWWAMAVAVCSPLLWFTGLRPLSDMTGLALAVASQVCLLGALAQPANRGAGEPANEITELSFTGSPVHRLAGFTAGAFLCGLSAGVRAQTVMLTAPLLLAVLVWPKTGLSFRARGFAVVAAVAGVLVWAIPLLAASGGLEGYLTALGSQAGEDFSGVVMVWTNRTARVAAEAVLNTFVWPWRQYRFGLAVTILAAIGAIRLGRRAPRGVVLVMIAFLPYAVFHLLFHETATMRYGAPMIVPIALLAAVAAAAAGRRFLTVAAMAAVLVSLAVTLPAARAYSTDGAPAFGVLRELTAIGTQSAPALGLHAAMRRVGEWEHDRLPSRVLTAAHGREWLALVEHWRAEPGAPVRFLADPRRTDLALFDPHARTLVASKRWTLAQVPFIAGTRPGNADGYVMQPPGWMLDRGWALTAEVAGVTARDGLGPHAQPSVAWVRSRSEAAELIVGGRQISGAPARLTLDISDRQLDTWDVTPGFFFRRVALPAGALAGGGYVPLRVKAAAADGSAQAVVVKLEQFDLQSGGHVMFGYADGWHEPEYNPAQALAWHWMSERGRLWVRPVGRDVVLTIAGESPLKYFESAPEVKLLAGQVEVARFTPAADFTKEVTIPAQALATADGSVTIESSLWFTPAQRGESADQRHLALRIFSISVR